jgi:hypothetical protein
VDDGVGDAKTPGLGQFFDAMGMKPGKQAFLADDVRGGSAQHTIDDRQQITVAFVEE